MAKNLITKAIEIVGLQKLARLLGVTYQAIRKWETKGRLPRTEWTGETDYAAQIEQATAGKVSKACLLAAQGWKVRQHRSATLPDSRRFATDNRGGKI